MATQGIVIGTVASLGAFALTALFLRWDGLRLNDVGAAVNGRSSLRLAIGFGLGLLIVALYASIVAVVGHVRWVRVPSVGVNTIAISLVAYLCLSCREELAFHGYPLRRLQSLFGVWVAQAIVALVFAAEHVAGGSAWGPALAGGRGVAALWHGLDRDERTGRADWPARSLESRRLDAWCQGHEWSLETGDRGRLRGTRFDGRNDRLCRGDERSHAGVLVVVSRNSYGPDVWILAVLM